LVLKSLPRSDPFSPFLLLSLLSHAPFLSLSLSLSLTCTMTRSAVFGTCRVKADEEGSGNTDAKLIFPNPSTILVPAKGPPTGITWSTSEREERGRGSLAVYKEEKERERELKKGKERSKTTVALFLCLTVCLSLSSLLFVPSTKASPVRGFADATSIALRSAAEGSKLLSVFCVKGEK
jgi:hypothetical protein